MLPGERLVENRIIGASVSFLDTMCDTHGTLVECNYFTKKGKTGQQIRDQFVKEIIRL